MAFQQFLKEVHGRLQTSLPPAALQPLQDLDALGHDKLGLEYTGAAVMVALAAFIIIAILSTLGR